ncbi:MAG: hypothetical protein SNJ67_04275 [Chloracidobacterium sp.]
MTKFFRRSLLLLVLVLLSVLGGEAIAQTSVENPLPVSTVKKVTRKKATRKVARRRVARKSVRRAAPVKPSAKQAARVKPTVKPYSASVAPLSTPATSDVVLTADSTPLTTTVDQVRYTLAGYMAAEDGSPVRVWHSREYTVRSPYAYLGRMKFGDTWQHVWMETSGTLLASAVTNTHTETLPEIAQMMERFPDGGQGVVVAGWDDFAPPVEPSVEVVEFGDTQPGVTR